MIVAITIILIVAMICGTALIFGYWTIIHQEVDGYVLLKCNTNVLKLLEENEKLYKKLEKIEKQIEERK